MFKQRNVAEVNLRNFVLKSTFKKIEPTAQKSTETPGESSKSNLQIPIAPFSLHRLSEDSTQI